MKNFIKKFNAPNLRRLLWSNTGTRQTIAKNTFWLGALELSINLLKFALLVYAARILGDDGFGLFSFVNSFVTIFGVLFEMGLSEAIIREFAKEFLDDTHIGALLSLKLLISFGTAVVLFGTSFFVVAGKGNIQSALFLLGGYVFLASLSGFLYAFFRARQKMELEFIPTFFQNGAIVGLGFFFLYYFRTVTGLTLAYFLGSILTLIPVMLYFHRTVAPLRLRVDRKIWKKFFRIAYPFMLIAIVSAAIYSNVDSLMLGFFGFVRENGWYNAAYRVITFSLLPMVFITQSFFPALSEAYHSSVEKMQRLFDGQQQVLIGIGLPIFCGGYMLAPSLIRFLYPTEFSPAVTALRILMIISFLMYCYMPLKQVLVVFNQQMKVFQVFLLGMVINIILNIVLIPRFNFVGTALSAAVTHGIILIGLTILVVKKSSIRLIQRSTMRITGFSVVSSLGMIGVLYLLQNRWTFLPLLIIGIGVYGSLFFLMYTIVKRYTVSSV